MLVRDELGEITRFKMGTEHQGRVVYWCAAWLVDGLVIDTGSANCAAEFLEALGNDLPRQAVNTHFHEDHSGGNPELLERGVPLFAPVASLELLATGWDMHWHRRLAWGQPRPHVAQPLGNQVSTDNFRFQVVPAPGHSHDQVVFWEPARRWAFVGDAFMGETPRTARPEEHLGQSLESMRRLAALEPQVMFTGLGRVIEDATTVLGRTIAYLADQQTRAAALAAQGLDPAAIAEKLYGPESSLAAFTEGQMSHANFVAALLKPGA